ncbi:MAG: hypothetical protein NTW56_00605 [Alphaproteobacteria bacterium]|nr:hypothetical protein [Alphaproteobacteria bacterium]
MSDAPEAPIEQLPPAMPPDVMEGMRRGDAAARALNGNAVVTRRDPDTNGWWVVVETNEGGPAWCVVSYTLSDDDTPHKQGWHTNRFAAEQAVERMAQGMPPEVPGLPDQPLPEPVTGTALEALKETLRRGVDSAAETARLRYITPGTGQAMVYLAKEEEARAVLALQGPPTAGEYPLLEADVSIGAAESVVAAAQTVATLASQWRRVAAEIETIRLGAKAAITAATDEAGARAAASRG